MCASGNGLGDVTRIADAAIGDQRHAGAFQAAGDVGHGRDLRHTDTGDDARGADGAGANTHLDCIGTGIGQVARGFGGGDVAGDHLQIGPLGLDGLHRVDDALRMTVGGIDHHDIDAGIAQRGHAIHRIGRRAHCSADAQATGLVLAGTRVVGGFLEVLDGDHAAQLGVGADHQHLLDAVLVQQVQHFVLGGVFTHRDQPLARGHDR